MRASRRARASPGGMPRVARRRGGAATFGPERLQLQVAAAATAAAMQRLRSQARRLRARVRELERECGGWQEEWPQARLSSPCTWAEQWVEPWTAPRDSGLVWKWFPTSCPCCKRPLDLTLFRTVASPRWSGYAAATEGGCVGSAAAPEEANDGTAKQVRTVADRQVVAARGEDEESGDKERVDKEREGEPPWEERFAYMTAIWGCVPGYAMGALVLGTRLRDLGTRHDLVLLHTDDVPPGHLDILAPIWRLQQVDYIDGVIGMFSSKGTRFDGVFTKINAWAFTEYSKVLLLDIDLIPMETLDGLFDVEAPAAMVRGNSDAQHGVAVDGRHFFLGDDHPTYPWGQGGGINAGVILLRPDWDIFRQMQREVTSEIHPEHMPGGGPEQDYLSRFFAAAPWKHISVAYNFQPHHVPFALEYHLNWLAHLAQLKAWPAAGQDDYPSGGAEAEAAAGVLVRGDHPQWDGREVGTTVTPHEHGDWLPLRLAIPLDEVKNVHFSGDVKLWDRAVQCRTYESDEEFTEHFLRGNLEGYARWVKREAPEEEYAERGCRLLANGGVELLADGTDVTELIKFAVDRVREVVRRAARGWRLCLERIECRTAVLRALMHPVLPQDSSWAVGAPVEVLWGTDWFPCVVRSVHADGRYVVRYERRGGWGDTERRVSQARLRLRTRMPDSDSIDYTIVFL